MGGWVGEGWLTALVVVVLAALVGKGDGELQLAGLGRHVGLSCLRRCRHATPAWPCPALARCRPAAPEPNSVGPPRATAPAQGKRVGDVVNRIHVALPKPRDNLSRPPVIPPGVEAARARRDAGEKRKTEKDLQARPAGTAAYLPSFLLTC